MSLMALQGIECKPVQTEAREVQTKHGMALEEGTRPGIMGSTCCRPSRWRLEKSFSPRPQAVRLAAAARQVPGLLEMRLLERLPLAGQRQLPLPEPPGCLPSRLVAAAAAAAQTARVAVEDAAQSAAAAAAAAGPAAAGPAARPPAAAARLTAASSPPQAAGQMRSAGCPCLHSTDSDG